MIWKRYQNEWIVAISFVLLVIALVYKNAKVSSGLESSVKVRQSTVEFKELLSLKKRWVDKKVSVKLDRLFQGMPKEKVKWSKKGKKLTASFRGLTGKELDKLITTVMNLAVQIQFIEINNHDSLYDMELKCKW